MQLVLHTKGPTPIGSPTSTHLQRSAQSSTMSLAFSRMTLQAVSLANPAAILQQSLKWSNREHQLGSVCVYSDCTLTL